MRVNDIMSTTVHTVGAEESATVAWETMRLLHTRHLVVVGDEQRVIGVISASDLGGKNGEPMRFRKRVRDLMTGKLVVAHPEMTAREAANLMRGYAVTCLPVFDHHDHLKGMVTVMDLLKLIGGGHEPMTASPRPVINSGGVVPRQSAARNRTRSTAR